MNLRASVVPLGAFIMVLVTGASSSAQSQTAPPLAAASPIASPSNSPAASTVIPAPIIPLSGATSKFHESFSGIFYNAQKLAIEQDIVSQTTSDTSVDFLVSTNVKSSKFTVKPGSASLTPAYIELEPMGLAYALGKITTPSALISLPLFVSRTGSEPVDIKTTISMNGSVRVIQGVGEKTGTFSFGTYDVPYDYKIRLVSQFSSDAMVQSQGEVEELVGSGASAQALSWQWTLIPQ